MEMQIFKINGFYPGIEFLELEKVIKYNIIL